MNWLRFLLLGLAALFAGCSDSDTTDSGEVGDPVRLSVQSDSSLVTAGEEEKSYDVAFRAAGG